MAGVSGLESGGRSAMASERVQRQIDRLLDGAEAAITRYDWEAVRQAAQAVLSLDAENTDARAYVAAAEGNLGGPHPPAPLPILGEGV